MAMIVCAICHGPADKAMLPKGGFADAPRPVCTDCWSAADHYYTQRFKLAALPDSATWLQGWRSE